MLPRNRLGEDIRLRMKVYAGPTHPHQAQKPEPWTTPTPEEMIARQQAVALQGLGEGDRRRCERPGWRGAPWRGARSPARGRDVPADPAQGWLPHARPAHEGAQEVRPQACPQGAAVHQALIGRRETVPQPRRTSPPAPLRRGEGCRMPACATRAAGVLGGCSPYRAELLLSVSYLCSRFAVDGIEAERLHDAPVEHDVALRIEAAPQSVAIVVAPKRPADAMALQGGAHIAKPAEAIGGQRILAVDPQLNRHDRHPHAFRPFCRPGAC